MGVLREGKGVWVGREQEEEGGRIRGRFFLFDWQMTMMAHLLESRS
jgi:hypothetical protein